MIAADFADFALFCCVAPTHSPPTAVTIFLFWLFFFDRALFSCAREHPWKRTSLATVMRCSRLCFFGQKGGVGVPALLFFLRPDYVYSRCSLPICLFFFFFLSLACQPFSLRDHFKEAFAVR